MNKDTKYLSPKQAADLIGCHYDTMDRWLITGKVPAARFGRTWIIPKDFVEQKIRENDMYNPLKTHNDK